MLAWPKPDGHGCLSLADSVAAWHGMAWIGMFRTHGVVTDGVVTNGDCMQPMQRRDGLEGVPHIKQVVNGGGCIARPQLAHAHSEAHAACAAALQRCHSGVSATQRALHAASPKQRSHHRGDEDEMAFWRCPRGVVDRPPRKEGARAMMATLPWQPQAPQAGHAAWMHACMRVNHSISRRAHTTCWCMVMIMLKRAFTMKGAHRARGGERGRDT